MYGYGRDYGAGTRPRRPMSPELPELGPEWEERQTPLPVSPMPEMPQPQRQEESPIAAAIRGAGDILGAGILARGGERNEAPPMPQQSRQPRVTRPNPKQVPDYLPPQRQQNIPGTPLPAYDDSGVGVPIPALRGTGGSPMPYDPVEKAKYEYATQEAKTARPIDPDNPETFYQPRKTKRSFWDTLKTAGVGALQGLASGGGIGGAIGGALAGGIGSAISPEMGRAYRFNTLQRPQMEGALQRQMQQELFRREMEKQGVELGKTQAETGRIQRETELMPERYRMETEERQSRMNLNKQRAQSLREPKPQKPSPGSLQRVRGPKGEETFAYVTPENAAQFRPYREPRVSRGGGGGSSTQSAGDASTLLQRVTRAAQDYAEAKAYADESQLAGMRDAYNMLAVDLASRFPQMYELRPAEDGSLTIIDKRMRQLVPNQPAPARPQPAAPAQAPAPSWRERLFNPQPWKERLGAQESAGAVGASPYKR